MNMIDYRPCGACGELVPATGCEHWQPRRLKIGEGMSSAARAAKRERDRVRQKARRERDRVALEAFRKTMGVGQ